MHFIRYHYPWLISCRVVFVDVPKIVKGGFNVASKIFDKVMTDRFFMSSVKSWINDDPDIKIYVETTNPDHALRYIYIHIHRFTSFGHSFNYFFGSLVFSTTTNSHF